MISDVKMRRKQVFQKRMETAQQENERLRHENQSCTHGNNNNFIYNRQPTSLLKCFSAGLCKLHSVYYYIKKLKVLFYIEKSRLY